ncbi:hypothetical protein AXX17_AT5G34340 [Arabidopsis thaliana]|uniref:Uncharacterized protein n=1 Tax=Arabidopsis thaliana TaxID=3702 RepID=A0A178URP3_ARATH|nr:hypothetical protein AXX17_AT5G34340 [Arabidopsis thaliana]
MYRHCRKLRLVPNSETIQPHTSQIFSRDSNTTSAAKIANNGPEWNVGAVIDVSKVLFVRLGSNASHNIALLICKSKDEELLIVHRFQTK